MTITIELPDELAARLAARLPEEERDRFAIAAIADALNQAEQADALPLRPFSEYASEADYVAAAADSAQAHSLDPDTCAAIAKGIADWEAGHTLSLSEARAQADAALAARFGKAGGA